MCHPGDRSGVSPVPSSIPLSLPLPWPFAASLVGGWLVVAAMLGVPFCRDEMTRGRLASALGAALLWLGQSVLVSADYVALPAEDLPFWATAPLLPAGIGLVIYGVRRRSNGEI